MHRNKPTAAYLMSLFLLVATPAVSAGCGTSEPGTNQDGGVDGDSDVDPQDAWVDNGPLDCGVRPEDGSVCVSGRFYDFETNEPVAPGVTNEIFTFGQGTEMLATRNASDTLFGHVAPTGRFVTWSRYGGTRRCLGLVDDVSGYAPATINCYSGSFSTLPDYPGGYRYYLVSSSTHATWVTSYPGTVDLQTERPLILGQCLADDWARWNFGEYSMQSSDHSTEWHLLQTCYPLTEDRLGFHDLDDLLAPIQTGGALLYNAPFEENGSPLDAITGLNFSCNDTHLNFFDYGRIDTEWGGVEVAILNNIPF